MKSETIIEFENVDQNLPGEPVQKLFKLLILQSNWIEQISKESQLLRKYLLIFTKFLYHTKFLFNFFTALFILRARHFVIKFLNFSEKIFWPLASEKWKKINKIWSYNSISAQSWALTMGPSRRKILQWYCILKIFTVLIFVSNFKTFS